MCPHKLANFEWPDFQKFLPRHVTMGCRIACTFLCCLAALHAAAELSYVNHERCSYQSVLCKQLQLDIYRHTHTSTHARKHAQARGLNCTTRQQNQGINLVTLQDHGCLHFVFPSATKVAYKGEVSKHISCTLVRACVRSAVLRVVSARKPLCKLTT